MLRYFLYINICSLKNYTKNNIMGEKNPPTYKFVVKCSVVTVHNSYTRMESGSKYNSPINISICYISTTVAIR